MKLRLPLSLVLSFFAVGISVAQGCWRQRHDLTGIPRWAAASFSINDKGYIVSGRNGSTVYGNNSSPELQDLWEWNSVTDVWSKKADLPLGRYCAFAFVIGNKAYAGSGAGANGLLNDLWEYDPVTDSWTQKANLPTAAFYGSASFSVNGKGYVCLGNEGGAGGPYSNKLWEYDSQTDTWTQKANFPGQARYGVRGFATSQSGYVGLGGVQGTLFNDFWEYDPSTDTWGQIASYPGDGWSYVAGFTINNLIYIGTGHKNGIAVNDMWQYDPVNNSWTQKAAYSGGPCWLAVGFSINNKGYLGTGADFSNSSFSGLWEYTPACQVQSFSEQSTLEDVQIYPNPFSGSVVIQLPQSDSATAIIYDVNGRRCFSSLIKNNSVLSPPLEEGVYNIQITTKAGTIRKILIKN